MNGPIRIRNKRCCASRSQRRAYTLIEILVVVGILGLAGSLLVPRLINMPSMRAQVAVRTIIADLSFAQSDALANQEMRRVVFFADGSGYAVVRITAADFNDAFDPDTADYIFDPLKGGTNAAYIVDFTTDDRFEGVSIANVDLDGGNSHVSFDELGGTIMTGSAPGIGGSLEIISDAEQYRINIAPFTGKLTVQKL